MNHGPSLQIPSLRKMSNPVLNQSQRFPDLNLPYFSLLVSVIVARIVMIQGDDIECGTVNLYRELIFGGNEVLRDEWPFVAALYRSRVWKYFCGGTIISDKHVLTAAHCIQGKFSNAILRPNDITVRLGAYNLTARSESGVVDRNVTKIHVHPDWNVLEEKYDADIAILVLDDTITFSSHIRPVCMPMDDVSIEGVKGTVVGWGMTENGTAEGIPRQTEAVALNDSYCYRRDNGIARYSSGRSFCGVGSGTPNKGDSGGGYFMIIGSSWVQYGIVSVVRTNGTGHVVTGSFAIYMKLTSLKHWVTDTVRQSGGTVSEATMKINLHCTYGYTTDLIYGCWLLDLNIRKQNFVVNSFTGSHELQKEDRDVESISFQNGIMFFLPDNFGNIFKNLKYLAVGMLGSASVDTKHICRSNFQNLQHLEEIRFVNNAIEKWDEDSLWDLPNLQSFQLKNNQLRLIHAVTFSRNSKLTTVFILSNDVKELPPTLFQNNLLLESVVLDENSIETIDENIFETNRNLKTVFFNRNRLERLSKNIFRNNLELAYVEFANNAINTIEEQTFQANSKLRTLSLGSNELKNLPEQLLKHKSFLEEIDFRKNSLEAIDEQFFETNVRAMKIYLGSNQLKLLPRKLFRNNALLEIVDIGENFIRAIDGNTFETNSLLRKINLESNFLEELPGSLFKNNSMLEFVNVRSNFLETIDEHTFETNGKLTEVYFGDNFVEMLPRELFQNNLLLNIANFTNNSLEAIDERLFQTNTNLREIYLSDNLLESLPTNLFQNNSLLEVIDLSQNFFETIDENIFRSNVRLRKISLEGNQLQSLPRELLEGNSFLEHIDLRGNSLKIIDIIFTQFQRAFYINLYENVCVDALFYNVNGAHENFHHKFKNLKIFQDAIATNCTQPINTPSFQSRKTGVFTLPINFNKSVTLN